MTPFSPAHVQGESERYSRQIRFAGIGAAGQRKLLDARVCIVGCGALGSFQAGALARAGVGFLRIVDRDFVEESNLQRQWLFEESDARDALPKAEAARRAIARINSGVRVEAAVADLTPSNAGDLLEDCDLVLDGTDNFETRYLINDFCVERAKAWIYGGAIGSYGITMTILPGETACFACVYPEPPRGAQPTCETAGVLGPAAAVVASLQTAAAIKFVCGEKPARSIATVDVWSGALRQTVQPAPDPACQCCAARNFRWLRAESRAPIGLCGRNAVQIHERRRPVDLQALATRLSPLGPVRANEFALRFSISPYEMTVFPDGRAIVKGTTDTSVARSVYARYIGA